MCFVTVSKVYIKHYFRYGPAIGLILIALGTGGIKPCVSAFGGDQFDIGQVSSNNSFFNICCLIDINVFLSFA